MRKVPFIDRDLQSAFMKSFTQDVSSIAEAYRNQYLHPDNVLSFNHGRRWEAPANKVGDRVGHIQMHGTETTIDLSDIVAGKVEVIFETAVQVSNSMHEQMTKMLVETLHRGTEATGQTVDASGRPMYEAMYEVLEKMPPTLNDDGELSMPTMFIHPSQSEKISKDLNSAGSDFERKFDALKERKRAEALKNEADRIAKFERRNDA